MLGFVIGPAPLPADPADAEPAEGERRSLALPSGYAVRGLNVYVWDEDAREAGDWAAELLHSHGETAESAQWRTVAAKSASLSPLLTRESEVEFVMRLDGSAGAGISPLGCLLCLLPSLDRTCLISSWATSSNEQTRGAVARALSAPFEAVGVRAVIEHLQVDPSAEVRRLARSAAAARRAVLG
jgi:hypothetical protein